MRYTGPSCRQCRREGTKLFLKGTTERLREQRLANGVVDLVGARVREILALGRFDQLRTDEPAQINRGSHDIV